MPNDQTPRESDQTHPLGDEVASERCSLVRAHGLGVVRDLEEFEKLFCKTFKPNRKELFLLTSALKAGVVSKLLAATRDVSIEKSIRRIAQSLHTSHAIVLDSAIWAIRMWSIAIGLLDQPNEKKIIPPLRKLTRLPI